MRGYDYDTHVMLFLPVPEYQRQVKGARPGRHGVWELSISEGCGMIVAVRMAGLIVIYDSVMDGRADCYI